MPARKYRSNFELKVARKLEEAGVKFEYEKETWIFATKPSNRYFCHGCQSRQSIVQYAEYTPDFFLPGNVVVETKGIFTARDRKALLYFRGETRDIRIVFQRNNKLNRRSSTRYTDWCEKHGIPSAVGSIPEAWIAS